MITRRRVVLALGAGALAAPLARAQKPGVLPRIGWLSFASSSAEFPEKQILEGLRELGWVDGKNVAIEYRYAGGDPNRLAELASELARLKVDVIVTSSAGVGAAKRATATIPVVFGTSQDPVRMAYVASLGRPGGNLTGVTFLTDELSAKRLELLRDTLRGISRVAILWEPAHLDNEFKGMQAAAPALACGCSRWRCRGRPGPTRSKGRSARRSTRARRLSSWRPEDSRSDTASKLLLLPRRTGFR